MLVGDKDMLKFSHKQCYNDIQYINPFHALFSLVGLEYLFDGEFQNTFCGIYGSYNASISII